MNQFYKLANLLKQKGEGEGTLLHEVGDYTLPLFSFKYIVYK